MKIVFWGTPKYAAENLVNLVNANYEVITVVTQPDRKRGRGKNLSPSPVKLAAINLGIPVLTTNSISKDEITKKTIFNLNADVFIVVAFGQILPSEILEKPKLGCWNSHASLLPAWRGAAPIQWSIINDDEKTGICIMAMEEGLDTGPVIEKESTDISDTDNLEILTNRLSLISSKLLVNALEKIKLTEGLNKKLRLKKLNAIQQSELLNVPSYARQIKKEDYLIDWNQKGRNIFKQIQGLFPNAYTYYKDKRIKILESYLIENYSKYIESNQLDYKSISQSSPGEVIMINKKNGILIKTLDNPILIKSGQLEGKTRVDAYTLSVQANLSINNILKNKN